MANRKSEKIEIISISYKVNGVKHTMKPPKKATLGKVAGIRALAALAEADNCIPGATRCVDHVLQRCFDIGEGQCVWMESNETC